jgi:hypothetical protein
MNTKRTFATIVFVALLSGACGATPTPAPMIPPTGPELIGVLSPEEVLVEVGPIDEMIQVTNTEDFFNNDTVRVTYGGIAKLDLLEGQISIRVFNDTELKEVIADPSETSDPVVRMKLVYGGLSGEVAKNGTPVKFNLTNGVNIYILGTQFLVIVDPRTGITYIGNFDGMIAYTLPGQQSTQLIQPGQLYELSPSFETKTTILNFDRTEIDTLTRNNGSNLLAALNELLVPTSTPTSEPTATPTPFPTITSTPTSSPTLTLTPTRTIPCDQAAFVADVTVPDGASFSPGVQFTKIWRLRNVGTCTWTNNYSLVFYRGDQMAGKPINVPSTVAPGQTVDLAVGLVAPTLPGSYRGEWMLRNASGTSFGVGANGTRPIWVTINVIPVTITTTVVSTGTITGTVFFDKDNDNTPDQDELTPNSQVTLWDSSNTNQITSSTTDGNGRYTFANLNPGAYVIRWNGSCNVNATPPLNLNAGDIRTENLNTNNLC